MMGRGHKGTHRHTGMGTTMGWSHHKAMEFWLVTMREHAVFIMNGLDCNRTDLKEQAHGYAMKYGHLLEMVGSGHDHHMHMKEAKELTESFLEFKFCILEMLVTCHMGHCGGNLTPAFMIHIADEAKHFLHFLSKPHAWKPNTFDKLGEAAFWFQGFYQHAGLIESLLDLSETELRDKAKCWKMTFLELIGQVMPLYDMVKGTDCVFPTAVRFLHDTKPQVVGLRDFKLHLAKLLAECKALGLLTPALMNHVAREAQYYLDFIG